ncbi:MAG: 2-phospho-L-lactate guanylyltransferase [Marinobacter sp.]
MSCWALIPLKTPGLGKTRLSARLSESGRKKLVETMLGEVLDALAASHHVDYVAIVGMSPQHCPPGVMHIADPGRGLNAALTHARNQLRAAGASELLVMHADLPFVESSEIDDFILCGRRQQIALASDHHGLGTNAIYLRQPENFAFNFGCHSLARHITQAEALNLKPALSKARGLLFDLDTVQDLNSLQNVTLPFGRPQPSAHWSLSHA